MVFKYSCIATTDCLANLQSSEIISPAINAHFVQQRGWIGNRLVQLIVEASDPPTSSYQKCCCQAAFLYYYLHLRPDSFISAVQRTVLAQLKECLLRTDLDAYWDDDIELLLWVLVTAASVEDVTKGWYIRLFKRVRNAFHPKPDLNRMRYFLRRFLWNERLSNPDCERVYKEIMNLDLEEQEQSRQIKLGLRPK